MFKLLKQLFCRHDFVFTGQSRRDWSDFLQYTYLRYEFKCKHCGKIVED